MAQLYGLVSAPVVSVTSVHPQLEPARVASHELRSSPRALATAICDLWKPWNSYVKLNAQDLMQWLRKS